MKLTSETVIERKKNKYSIVKRHMSSILIIIDNYQKR